MHLRRIQRRQVGAALTVGSCYGKAVPSIVSWLIIYLASVLRLGKSELTLVQLVIDGINELIECEKALENGQDISPRIMGLAAKN